MKAFLIEHILSLFTGKELNAGQMKVFLALMVSGMGWLSVSQNRTTGRLMELQAQVNYMPEMIQQQNQELAQMLYADAQKYSAKVIECIIKANTDILFQLDISERERDKAIRAIESRFDGIRNEVEQLQNQYKYLHRMFQYKNQQRDSAKINWRQIGQSLFDRPRPTVLPVPYWGVKVWQS